jgi:hypothetical protein
VRSHAIDGKNFESAAGDLGQLARGSTRTGGRGGRVLAGGGAGAGGDPARVRGRADHAGAGVVLAASDQQPRADRLLAPRRRARDHDGEEIVLYDPRDESFTYLTDNDVQDWLPDINDAGEITWTHVVSPERRGEIVLWSEGRTRMLTDNNLDDLGSRINNLGHVTWQQLVGQPCTRAEVFFYDGMQVRQITNNGYSNQGPAINDNDDIAWTRYNFCVNPWEGEIMLYSAGRSLQLTTGGLQRQSCELNDRRVVIWDGQGDGGDSVERWEAGKTTIVTDEGGGAYPNINYAGVMLYSIFDDKRSTYHAFWRNRKRAWQLTHSEEWGFVRDINELAEAVYTLGYQVPEALYLLKRAGTPGDVDGDADLDLGDFARLQRCAGRPAGMNCEGCDQDLDDRITLRDARLLALRLTGPR